MNRIQANVRMLWADYRLSYLIFWAVLITIFALIVFFSIFVFDTEETVYIGSGMSAVWVYFFIAGTLQLAGTFRFALGLSVTRREYFASTVMFWLLMTAGTGVIQMVGYLLERTFFQHIEGLKSYFFVMFANMTVWDAFLTGFAVPLFFVSLGLLASSGTYRIGHVAWIASIGVVLLAVMTIHLLELWDDVWRLLQQIETVGEAALWLVIGSAIFFMLSWLLLRRAPVKTGR